MANAMVNIQIIPSVESRDEVYPAVDAAIAVIQESGVKYEVGGLGTTMEGDFDELLDIVKEMNHAMIERGSPAVIAQVRTFLTSGEASMDGLTAKFRE